MTTIRQHKLGKFDKTSYLRTRVSAILCELPEKTWLRLHIEVVPGTPRRAWQGSVYTRAWGSSDELPQLFVCSRVVDILRLGNPGDGYSLEGAGSVT